MRNHLMIDIETYGRTPGAAIASIGAVFFDPHEDNLNDLPDDIPLFYKNISLDSCLQIGLKTDAPTIEWWVKQGEEARQALETPTPIPVTSALYDFKRFYWDQKEELGRRTSVYVWSHGATFDIPMIAVACNQIGWAEPPWVYYNCRDTRTLFDLAFKGGKPKSPASDIKHYALGDAIAQAVQVQEAYRALGI